MKLKNILTAGLLSLGIAAGLMSCSEDEDPFFTASSSDSPRILNTDIPQSKNGAAPNFSTINRTERFTYELIVTPVEGATAEWFVDDEKVAEGLSIDISLETGVHTIKVVVKTAGGETSRTFTVTVQPLATDPVLANKAKERLVKPGDEAVLHGTNLENVVKILIGVTAAECVYNEDGYLSYTVPAGLAEGVYNLYVVDKEGNSFACGEIELSENPVFTEIEVENEIWSGEATEVDWDKCFYGIKDYITNNTVKAGTVLRVYIERLEDADYAKGCITNINWKNIETGIGDDESTTDVNERGDVDITTDTKYLSATLSELSLTLAAEENPSHDKGIMVVGHGYKITKITIVSTDEEATADQTLGEETEIWSGESAVTWNATFEGVKEDTYGKIKDGTIKAGSV
ncbi:MAG: hypothetical protein K5685_09250, partial [Bacteroidales bacterium]|nr:hypothetical protein [Bacteroidales bacterium]